MNAPLGSDPTFRALVDKFKALATAADMAEAERIAGLSPGVCQKCEGAGVYELFEVGLVRCSECSRQTVVQSADGVPYEFQSVTLDTYEERNGQSVALKAAKAFLADPSRDLYLTGGVGAGKTRVACAVLNSHVQHRKTGYFARVPMLLYELQPGRDAEKVSALEDRLFKTSLLVLDDLGAERDQATDYTRRTLLMIYEQRCDRGLRTIFTSNKSIQELAAMQDDDRLASRIAGRADVVKVSATDQRVLRRVK